MRAFCLRSIAANAMLHRLHFLTPLAILVAVHSVGRNPAGMAHNLRLLDDIYRGAVIVPIVRTHRDAGQGQSRKQHGSNELHEDLPVGCLPESILYCTLIFVNRFEKLCLHGRFG